MFGYIKPDNPYLYLKDDRLYKSLYCGVCKAIGGTCGQMARMSLTYDIAFLSATAHNIIGQDVEIKNSHCIIHPIRKRPIAKPDELTNKLAAVNVILAYYKLKDDITDEGKGNFKSFFLKGGYKKAKRLLPEVDKIVDKYIKQQIELEKNKCTMLDAVCDPSAKMLAEISDVIFADKKTEYTYKLFYAVGKWVYLIDALDDYGKDIKKKSYNLLKLVYNAENAKNLIKSNGENLAFVFNDVFTTIQECVANIKFYFNSDLVKNILLRGITATTNEVVKRIEKC